MRSGDRAKSVPDLCAQQNEDRSIRQEWAPRGCGNHPVSHVIAARRLWKHGRAVDGEEYSSSSNKGEDERSRPAMLAQMEPGDQHREQECCRQERFQIAVVQQESCPQGREQPDQGGEP